MKTAKVIRSVNIFQHQREFSLNFTIASMDDEMGHVVFVAFFNLQQSVRVSFLIESSTSFDRRIFKRLLVQNL